MEERAKKFHTEKEGAGEDLETKPQMHIYLNEISELYPRGI